MLGSAAIDLTWVAAGRLNANIMLSNKPWNVAAGIIVAREAGARVLDHDGSDHQARSTATISASSELAPAVVDLIARTAEYASTWSRAGASAGRRRVSSLRCGPHRPPTN